MGIPLVQITGGFVVGYKAEVNSLDLPPDLTTNIFFFDFGLQLGTLFGKEIKTHKYDNQ